MYLGLDLGTSAVKALLVDDDERVVDQASVALDVQRPQPLWSEQDPAAWWGAVVQAMGVLRTRQPAALAAVRGIGLAGQMHGAVLLDAADRVLRPAILWNDGRSAAQCAVLLQREPGAMEITGNLAMPGFTAPKLLWVAEHEPDIFRQVRRVLLPKDYIRLRLCGEYASDMSDASGTLWLDVGRRRWSHAMLAATGLDDESMPRVVEGTEITGALQPQVAADWGMRPGVAVAAGAGDNAAGAVGVGVIRRGQAFLSLGTSGVLFAASDAFSPNAAQAVHTFCHCVPRTWHYMSVILSAASCLAWVTTVTGAASQAALLAEIETAEVEHPGKPSSVIFLPYLSGERTPHNDPQATGVFFRLTHETSRADLGRAVLEGVAFAFADGRDVLLAAGADLREVAVIGGGARSALWGRVLASVLRQPLVYHAGGEVGPAFGAARLARLSVSQEDPTTVCTPPPIARVVEPDADLAGRYAKRLAIYRQLYRTLRESFAMAG
jgi:xylulokinase